MVFILRNLGERFVRLEHYRRGVTRAEELVAQILG